MAENKKSQRLFNLPETKGTFQLEGLITDCGKDDFYKEGKTRNNKDKRTLSFGVKTDPDTKVTCKVQAYEKEFVYFSKRVKNGDKTEYKTKKIPWADRHKTVDELGLGEGWSIIGSRVGLEKEMNKEGELANKKMTLEAFDLAKYASVHMKDDQSVFVNGNLEYGSFTDDSGDKYQWSRLTPTQISLLSKDIDFSAEDRQAKSVFKQTIVFTGIEQEKENDIPTGRYIVYAKIVGYSSINDAEFYIINKSLAKQFKNSLKPYSSIEVWGNVTTEIKTEDVEVEDDGWGEADPTKRIVNSARKELIITGANGKSIDTDTFSREEIEKAIEAIRRSQEAVKDYGESNTTSNTSDTDDDWGASFDDSNAMSGDVW